MEYKSAIIMYTIESDETRADLEGQLQQRYGVDLVHLDQSTFTIPIRAVNPREEIAALRHICNNIVQNGHTFSENDTFKFCCSARMLDIEDLHQRDKIAIEDVFDGVNRTRRRLFG